MSFFLVATASIFVILIVVSLGYKIFPSGSTTQSAPPAAPPAAPPVQTTATLSPPCPGLDCQNALGKLMTHVAVNENVTWIKTPTVNDVITSGGQSCIIRNAHVKHKDTNAAGTYTFVLEMKPRAAATTQPTCHLAAKNVGALYPWDPISYVKTTN